MGNAASDLAFPDNPKRRKRAEGLRQDILEIIRQFKSENTRKSGSYTPLNSSVQLSAP